MGGVRTQSGKRVDGDGEVRGRRDEGGWGKREGGQREPEEYGRRWGQETREGRGSREEGTEEAIDGEGMGMRDGGGKRWR